MNTEQDTVLPTAVTEDEESIGPSSYSYEQQDAIKEEDDDVSYASSSASSSSSYSFDEADTFPAVLPPPPMTTETDGPIRFSSPNLNTTIANTTPINNTIRNSTPTDRSNASPLTGYRPRSNPRTRTPMRSNCAVSPAVNRSTVHNDTSDNDADTANRRSNGRSSTRVQVGLGAGLAVGTILQEDRFMDSFHRRQRLGNTFTDTNKNTYNNKSDKQNPSHRKQRRWDNDKFVGITSDLTHENTNKGIQIAKLYADAQQDYHKWINPLQRYPVYKSQFEILTSGNCLGREVEDEKGVVNVVEGKQPIYSQERISNARERFLRGEIAVDNNHCNNHTKRDLKSFRDGKSMLRKMEKRLRRVVERACRNSDFSKEVLIEFEWVLSKFLLHDTEEKDRNDDEEEDKEQTKSVLDQVLIRKPLLTRTKSTNRNNNKMLRFLFRQSSDDDENNNNNATMQPNPSFNRLLLHALCQFHGLESTSSTTANGRRLLTVTGKFMGDGIRLVDFLNVDEEEEEKDDIMESLINAKTVESSMSSASILKPLSTLTVS